MSEHPLDVSDNVGAHRFEAHLDGRLAGHVRYRLRPDRIQFVHTEVDPAFEGQGVGSALARAVLDEARGRHLAVVATCPFIAAYIRGHDEYADLVADAT